MKIIIFPFHIKLFQDDYLDENWTTVDGLQLSEEIYWNKQEDKKQI